MQKSKQILSHTHLREILHYSIITGQFYWLKSTNYCIKVGSIAGCLDINGYRKIQINKIQYYAQRLAWFYCTGEWPENEIDHKNGVEDANYWLNLREATSSQNKCNKSKQSNNTSGYKGVSWHIRDKKWTAQIMINEKSKHLGYYATPELAYEKYLKAERELHGDFARI